MQAVLRSDVDGVRAAAASGADLAEYDTAADGVSALFYAITRGDLETVTALVKLGADVNQPVWRDGSGSPLWFAQNFWGMLEIADFLRERGAAYFSEETDD